MMRTLKLFTKLILLSSLATALVILPFLPTSKAQRDKKEIQDDSKTETISEDALRQIQSLLDEKEKRTPEQRKISSSLLYGMRERRGERLTDSVSTLRSKADIFDRESVLVDIKCEVSKTLIGVIEEIGGETIYASQEASSIRARIPIDSVEKLASISDVRFIRPAVKATTSRRLMGNSSANEPMLATPLNINPILEKGLRPDFTERAIRVRERLSNALQTLESKNPSDEIQDVAPQVGSVTSQGDATHRAGEARNFFAVSGAGVKIGVLSDSVRFLAQVQASGDLPSDVTVLPGQGGPLGIGEGTAMLEIIHDLAPGAKLFFATAFTSDASFADNIRALRAAGCNIIVDDVIYSNESPFQDNIIAAAVNDVTNDGALYFSSAGNQGNFSDGTSSVWEGDFQDGGILPILTGGTVHDFGSGVISNRVESTSPFVLALFWSDPFDASGNDYDFFIMNQNLTAIIDASTDVQDGNDDPFEITFGAFANERIVILKKNSAQQRAIHINNFGGQLGISTPGQTHGHNSAAKAFGVSATPASPPNGPFPNPFNSSNTVELFNSDGPRRVFFRSNGTPYTPGRFLFSNNGGQVRQKPDLTAADGVSCATPGFATFFGTSAAAPHAAAIAALIKSARPALSDAEVRTVLETTATDIEAAGPDRDSGAGIVEAFSALFSIGAPPAPFLELGTRTATPVGGDGDPFIEPGEAATLSVQLINTGGATALNPSATLTTMTPGVTITTGTSTYPNIGSNGQSATNNTLFRFNLASTAPCGLRIQFRLTVTYLNSNVGPQVFNFAVQTGQPSSTVTAVSYTGPPAPIPDNNPAGVSVPIVVSGATGGISSLRFSFDGTMCTSAIGATTVGLDHTWVGDLVITLTSPQGTTITLMSSPGGVNNSGNNFCNTMLDDAATNSIQAITPAGNPYVGTFRPASPFSSVFGENPNGTWTVKVVDVALFDAGNVRAFTLRFTTFQCN